MKILFINKKIKSVISEYYAPVVFIGILFAILAFFTHPTDFHKRYYASGVIDTVVLDSEIAGMELKGLSGSALRYFYKIKILNSSNIYMYVLGNQMPNKKHKKQFLNKEANIEYWNVDNRNYIRGLIIDGEIVEESGYYGLFPFLLFVIFSIIFLYIGSWGWYVKEWVSDEKRKLILEE